jgi:hypothetical protein
LPLSDKKMAAIAAKDVGKCALGIFKRGPELVGERIGVAGVQLTRDEMAEAFSKATSTARSASRARRAGGNTYHFYVEFDDVVNSTREVERCRSLNPELQSLDAWLASNKGRIPLG